MLTKYFASATAVAGTLFLASGAQATAVPFSCVVNNATCLNSFKNIGNNSAVGSAADSVDWGQFATNLHTSQNNGAIANNASQTTPNNDTVKVTSSSGNAFTTYVEGLGTAPTMSGHTPVPGTAWDGLFAAGATILFAGSGTITLSFATPLIGLGIDAQVFNAGGYTETLQAYNSAGTLLGTSTQTGISKGVNLGVLTNEGTVPFVGISTDAQNNASSLATNGISYVTISTSCTSVTIAGNTTAGCSSTGGFAIDTSLIYHYPIAAQTGGGTTTPEPGTLSLLGAGLVALGYVRRRRNKTA
ncbi:MAG TPA: PEP-CTERM sorting domain-containing protein [Alphaproteobacteria bacterium]|jgi:hypothetical protein|nr:PEP-CTERM sorting domain-containing protein [Alphaproteobacteria bacterium]